MSKVEKVELGSATTQDQRKELEKIAISMTVTFPCRCSRCGYDVRKDEAVLAKHKMGGLVVVHEKCLKGGD